MVRSLPSFTNLFPLIALVVASGPAAFAGEPPHVQRFIRVGPLPGDVGSTLTAISGNGHRAAGISFDDRGGEYGFWWSQTTGVVPLRGAALGDRPSPMGLSFDGALITGGVFQGFESIDAAWWMVPGPSTANMMGEVDLEQPGSTEGLDMSADGSVIVGIADACTCDLASQAFRWTREGGMEGLGWFESDEAPFYSRAHAVNADGSVIVGVGEVDVDTNDDGIPDDRLRLAMRYTDRDGMENLGDLMGGRADSRAFDVTADGSLIVGAGTTAEGPEAFVWADGGIQTLGDLPGGIFGSEARGVSADGSVIVGFGEGPDGGEAVVWIDGAIHALRALVIEAGYDLDAHQFSLDAALDVSDDGRSIVGRGVQQGRDTGWIIRLAR
ncbi:MAG: hypothetical protein HKN62_11150 [Phycisphaerales bacterium]|nr:hypothetical protein [Phycisphaerales bacterium]